MERERFIYMDFAETMLYRNKERNGFDENVFIGFSFELDDSREVRELDECAWFMRSTWIGLPHRGSFVLVEYPEVQKYIELDGFSDNAYFTNDERGLLTESGSGAFFVNIDWLESHNI